MLRRILITISLIFSLNCFATDITPRFFNLNDFSKGQNSHISEYKIPKGQGVLFRDVRVNEEFGNIFKRIRMIKYGSAITNPITSIHRYYKADDTSFLITTTGTIAQYGTDSDGSQTDLKTGLSDGKRWQWVTYKDVAIGMNGTDKAQKWDGSTDETANTDGHRTTDELTTELGAAFAELDTGTDLDASSWYQYKVAFFDGTLYEHSTSRSNPILTGAAVHNIALTDIPIGDTGTTTRYIYRTVGNASKVAVLADTSYFLVGTLSDNSTRTFADTVTDATALGDSAPTWATASAETDVTPPLGKFSELHKQRLFITGNNTFPSDMYWSDEFNPDFFDPADMREVRPDDGDKMTGMKNFLGLLTLFKTNTVMKFYTNKSAEADWEVSDPFSEIGCPAPYSIDVTPLGIFYYSRFGLYNFNGQQTQLISDAVTDLVRDVAQAEINNIFGFYFNNEYQFTYTSEESGDAFNNRVLIYDVIRDSYVLDFKNINCFTVLNAGNDFGVLYSGSSLSSGFIFAHENTLQTLIIRYKSDIDTGTFSDTNSDGTEDSPTIGLSRSGTIDEMSGIINDLTGTINVSATSGTWDSAISKIDAGALSTLSWNEDLGGVGNITFQVKPCDDDACSGESFGAVYTDPNGSDISGVTADDYIQLRANFTTSDASDAPFLFFESGFVTKVLFSKTSDSDEGDFLSQYDSGWRELLSGYTTSLQRIKVFYRGTSGTLNIRYFNDEGDFDDNFDIDLSVTPSSSVGDSYTGVENTKIFTYFTPSNDGTSPIGQFWRFNFAETGDVQWGVERIEVMYYVEEIVEWEGQ